MKWVQNFKNILIRVSFKNMLPTHYRGVRPQTAEYKDHRLFYKYSHDLYSIFYIYLYLAQDVMLPRRPLLVIIIIGHPAMAGLLWNDVIFRFSRFFYTCRVRIFLIFCMMSWVDRKFSVAEPDFWKKIAFGPNWAKRV